MPDMINYAKASQDLNKIKDALQNIGCDVCDVNDYDDVADKINCLCTGPHAVVNATLVSGPGVAVTPVGKRGFKLTATDNALIGDDIDDVVTKGSSVHKALFYIIRKLIPQTEKNISVAQSIGEVTVFRSTTEGTDYYSNPAFLAKGRGTKTGLQPSTWYMKIYTVATPEPIYVSFGTFVNSIEKNMLCLMYKQCNNMVNAAIANHIKNLHIDADDSVPTVDPSVPGCDCGCQAQPGDQSSSSTDVPSTPTDCPVCTPSTNDQDLDDLLNDINNEPV